MRRMGLADLIDPCRGFADTDAGALACFDLWLKGKPAPLLDAPGLRAGAAAGRAAVSRES
jgi:hypothetical protein